MDTQILLASGIAVVGLWAGITLYLNGERKEWRRKCKELKESEIKAWTEYSRECVNSLELSTLLTKCRYSNKLGSPAALRISYAEPIPQYEIYRMVDKNDVILCSIPFCPNDEDDVEYKRICAEEKLEAINAKV